jgi:NIPSNAP
MITLCIRYELNQNKLRDFEAYARSLPEPIKRCGGDLIGYFLPTKFAGRTDQALALISFPDLAAYQKYREALQKDSKFIASVRCMEDSGCVLCEDRSFLQLVS